MFYVICMYGRTYSKSVDQPGEVANPARRVQLSRELNISLSAFAPENLHWSRETGSTVPSRVSLLISILRLNILCYIVRNILYNQTTFHVVFLSSTNSSVYMCV